MSAENQPHVLITCDLIQAHVCLERGNHSALVPCLLVVFGLVKRVFDEGIVLQLKGE